MISLIRICPVLLSILIVAGCSTYIETELPPSPISSEDKFSAMLQSNNNHISWQSGIQSSQLTELIEQALSQNLDIGMAFDRLNAARATRGIAAANQRPSISLNAWANRVSQKENSLRTNRNEFSANSTLSWELDIWNRIASNVKAADFDLQAQESLAAQTETLVVAELVQLYQEIHFTERLIELLKAQTKTNTEFLNLTRFRFANGHASGLEINQQESQLIQTKELHSELKRELANLQTSISIVLGVSPLSKRLVDIETNDLQPPSEIPSPRRLIDLRPDLRAAFYELKSADYDVAASIADRLPRISISLLGSISGSGLGSLGDNNSLSLGPFMDFPIFDGGKRAREVERRKAILSERFNLFSKKTLIAIKEVEDSLTSLSSYEEQISLKVKQVNTSSRSVALARQRYLQGEAQYITVLDALRTLQDEERKLIELARKRSFTIIAMYKSIGGQWKSTTTDIAQTNKKTNIEDSHAF